MGNVPMFFQGTTNEIKFEQTTAVQDIRGVEWIKKDQGNPPNWGLWYSCKSWAVQMFGKISALPAPAYGNGPVCVLYRNVGSYAPDGSTQVVTKYDWFYGPRAQRLWTGKRRLKDVKVDPLRPTEAALTWRMIPDKPRRDE